MAYLSGQLPFAKSGEVMTGRLGETADIETGRKAAEACGIRVLAQLKAALGSLERIERIVRLGVFVASADDFTQQPKVRRRRIAVDAGDFSAMPDAMRGPPSACPSSRSARWSRSTRLWRFVIDTPAGGKFTATIGSSVRGHRPRPMGRGGRRRQSIRQPRLPQRARTFGERRRKFGMAAGAVGRRHRLRARLSQDAQPGRIYLRSQLGRRVGARRWQLLSQIADRGTVHPGAGPAPAGTRRAHHPRIDPNGRTGGHAKRAEFGARQFRRAWPASTLFREAGWLIREGQQFHWTNRGYRNFDAFLGDLSSRKRKAIRKERREAQTAVEIVGLTGDEIDETAWDAFWHFYQDTGSRKWGQPYLTRQFFSLIGQTMGDKLLLVMARRDGVWIAGALNFIGGDTLYGRYWGCIEEVPYLHFELCYYPGDRSRDPAGTIARRSGGAGRA